MEAEHRESKKSYLYQMRSSYYARHCFPTWYYTHTVRMSMCAFTRINVRV